MSILTRNHELAFYLQGLIGAPDEPALIVASTDDLDDPDHQINQLPDSSLSGLVIQGQPTPEQAERLLAKLRPGAHICLVAPDEEPTGHTGAINLEDAGFEIRDAIAIAEEPGGLHYVPKASRSEREAGLEELSAKPQPPSDDPTEPKAKKVKNVHPTVKSLGLMRRLTKDAQPPICDFFMGSGSTALACIEQELDFIGVEREATDEMPYMQIAEARIFHWDQKNGGGATIISDLSGTFEGSSFFFSGDTIRLHLGDCLDILPTMEDESVGTFILDPPYSLSFMGKTWDSFDDKDGSFYDWCLKWLAEAFRILRPGGQLKTFGAPRTFHRLAKAMQAAGFVLDPLESWCFGSGFPKSLNIEKALKKIGEDEAAERLAGWGTALKPAFEPILIGVKP